MLTLNDIQIRYGNVTAVNYVSLSLKEGQIGCLLGPSGCGKTSTLRAIAGFEHVASGSIELRGALVSSASTHIPPEKRHMSVVFQDFALFPHMSIADNIAFGLHTVPQEQRHARVDAMLDLIGLPNIGERYPHELSGGQQQRVALARALAPEPDLILLDEPFSSLDADLREELAKDIRRILKHQKTSALMVTHDQHEAFAIADVIGVMCDGALHQWDSAYGLYHRPVSRFVADFIGSGVLIPGVITEHHQVDCCLGQFALSAQHQFDKGARVEVLVRPDDIEHDDKSPQKARILNRMFRGSHIMYELGVEGSHVPLLCLAPSHHDHEVGEQFGIKTDLAHVVMFARAS
ncbi:ABC transporter ATP-binding protein [Aestuariibacter sp. AA17]|uniref:ABC transporter ATP-binding protein n=1 Tax=Fluctibacter corallii TaxID=2984329 RepID=A0ABT3AA63_9ALTE|nr:ABC transporter ATP-binding protein [Aestuariibacter sp. AA17]MCV2885565.1 ABC transporter ATP-binding protein [Aestuariibacter sp. AA17]